jgi:hypothetical protein
VNVFLFGCSTRLMCRNVMTGRASYLPEVSLVWHDRRMSFAFECGWTDWDSLYSLGRVVF